MIHAGWSEKHVFLYPYQLFAPLSRPIADVASGLVLTGENFMSKKNGKKKQSTEMVEKVALVTETEMFPLKSITGNTAQSRGTGVLAVMRALGYGDFEKITADKPAIWPMLMSEKPEEQLAMCELLETNEPSLVSLAGKLRDSGQLQPIGIHAEEDNGEVVGDIMWGARRAFATAYNYAKLNDGPDAVEAKVTSQDLSPAQKKFLALEENQDREDENPIDLAITYQDLFKNEGFSKKDIGERVGISDQMVGQYLNLLDPLLADKRLDIQTRKFGIQKANDLLVKRKQEGANAETTQSEAERAKWPSVKATIASFDSKFGAKGMPEDTFEFFKCKEVREFIAHCLDLPYKPYVEPTEAEKIAAGEAAAAEKKAAKPDTGLKVTHKRAVALLEALGKKNASTWSDELLTEKMQEVVNMVDEGEVLEPDSLHKLLQRLVEAYAEDRKVTVVPDEVKEKKEEKKPRKKKEKAEASA
jgi:ParB/RepB/Spo0J family partition protein